MADPEAMQQAIMQAAKEARKATVKALTEINEGNRRPDTGTRQVIMGKRYEDKNRWTLIRTASIVMGIQREMHRTENSLRWR